MVLLDQVLIYLARNFRGDPVEDVEILGVENILKFSSEINSGKKVFSDSNKLNKDPKNFKFKYYFYKKGSGIPRMIVVESE